MYDEHADELINTEITL